MRSKKHWLLQDCLVSLTLSTLCFTKNLWLQFGVGLGSPNSYYLYAPTSLAQIALLLDILGLAIFILLVLSVSHSVSKKNSIRFFLPIVYLFLGGLLVLPLIAFGRDIQALIGFPVASYLLDNFSKGMLSGIFSIGLLPLIILYFRFWTKVIWLFRAVMIVLGPLFFMLALQLTISIANPYLMPTKGSSQISIQQEDNSPPRILWLIFDEMDQVLTFEERIPGVKIPHLDRLVGESFYGTHALSPDTKTMLSIPKMITGMDWQTIDNVNAHDLQLSLSKDKNPKSIKNIPNIFSTLNQKKYTSAVIGVYHPYCRIFGDQIDYCMRYNNHQLPLSTNLFTQMKNLFLQLPLRRHAYYNIALYQQMLPRSLQLVKDSRYNFVYLHWLIPHSPWIFNFETQQIGALKNSDPNGYFHNLSLVDKTLGQIRSTMEEAGTWEKTIVLLTSDHHYREQSSLPKYGSIENRMNRIPFILKLPGQNRGLKYSVPFNTRLSYNLLLELSENKLNTYEDIQNWIDHRN